MYRLSNHLKTALKGRLIEKDFNDPKEAKFMLSDEGMSKYNARLSQDFSFLKKTEQNPSMVRTSKTMISNDV